MAGAAVVVVASVVVVATVVVVGSVVVVEVSVVVGSVVVVEVSVVVVATVVVASVVFAGAEIGVTGAEVLVPAGSASIRLLRSRLNPTTKSATATAPIRNTVKISVRLNSLNL